MTENILKYETEVLDIVQRYLNQNRFFQIEEIVPHINFRLKEYSIDLNHNGIKEILKVLIKKKSILERSKLVRNEILKNENRKKIYNFICEVPGVYFNRIKKRFKLTNNILAWHVKILLKFECIRSKDIENHEAFFKKDLSEDNDELLFFLSKTKSTEIINYLEKYPEGIYKTQICKDLGVHSTTISSYFKRFEQYGLLLKEKVSKKTLYVLNEKKYNKIIENSDS